MDSTQTPHEPHAPQAAVSRKGWNPLILILLISAGFFFLFLLGSGLLFLSRGPGISGGSRSAGGFFNSGGEVAVVEVTGVIMDSKKIVKKLQRFEEDGAIKAVVLRLNSPGGAVAPSQEIYQAVKNYKKPILASMGSVAASGAYYIACGAKKIYADPGTITGSIGVIMEFVNLSKLYDWAKVQRYSIKTGKFKDAGAEFREMTAEEKALFQAMVDDVLGQFKQAVSTGRKLSLEEVTKIADGRIFSGNQAKKVKLVDELGTLDDAVKEAGKIAGIKGKPTVVYPEKQHKGLLDLIVDQGQNGDEDSESSESQTHVSFVAELAHFITGKTTDSLAVLSPGIYWLWTGH